MPDHCLLLQTDFNIWIDEICTSIRYKRLLIILGIVTIAGAIVLGLIKDHFFKQLSIESLISLLSAVGELAIFRELKEAKKKLAALKRRRSEIIDAYPKGNTACENNTCHEIARTINELI